MLDIQGRIQSTLEEFVERDVERGLQVAAYFRGELVVDAWAGVADATTNTPMDGDTLFNVFSVGKAICATVIHQLADRGEVGYDAPVARYWPEFAANGKAGVTLRHVLSHRSGVPQMPDEIRAADLCDWDKTCRAIANLRPVWEPGTRTGYHHLSYGHILGEVARRVDGRPFERIVREEICHPLGVDSLHFGIPDAVEDRVATLEAAPGPDGTPPPPPGVLNWHAVPPDLLPIHEGFSRPEIRRACIPAGGIANARAIALICAALAGASPDRVQLLTPERVRIATALETDEMDLVLGVGHRRGLGYVLGKAPSPMGQRMAVFGHSGAGGSLGYADPEYRFAFALTKNRLVSGLPEEGVAYAVAREIRSALSIPD